MFLNTELQWLLSPVYIYVITITEGNKRRGAMDNQITVNPPSSPSSSPTPHETKLKSPCPSPPAPDGTC